MSTETNSSKYGFDDLLDDVRQFGPFQWRVFIIASIFEAPAAMGLLFFVFGGANPGWHCEGLTNTTLSSLTNSTPLILPISPGETLSDSNHTKVDQCLQECPVRVYNDDFTSVVTEVRPLPCVTRLPIEWRYISVMASQITGNTLSSLTLQNYWPYMMGNNRRPVNPPHKEPVMLK